MVWDRKVKWKHHDRRRRVVAWGAAWELLMREVRSRIEPHCDNLGTWQDATQMCRLCVTQPWSCYQCKICHFSAPGTFALLLCLHRSSNNPFAPGVNQCWCWEIMHLLTNGWDLTVQMLVLIFPDPKGCSVQAVSVFLHSGTGQTPSWLNLQIWPSRDSTTLKFPMAPGQATTTLVGVLASWGPACHPPTRRSPSCRGWEVWMK